MNTNTPKIQSSETRIATVREIGKGIVRLETMTAEIVASLPDDFDPKGRGAVAGAVHAFACGDAPVPTQKDSTGKRTHYGIGADALISAVKRALSTPDSKVTLRATLSGEGGGSVTIGTDHALYAAIVALITEGNEA